MTEYNPVLLTWSYGWTAQLSRDGDVVTCVVTMNANTGTGQVLPFPPGFKIYGSASATAYNALAAPTATVQAYDQAFAGGSVGLYSAGSGAPGSTMTLRWLAEPEDPVVGGPFNMRDSLVQFFAQSQDLRDLGLPEDAVFQADTVESPKVRPFLVLRWGDREDSLGKNGVWPVDGWVYDEMGDYTRATNIAKKASEIAAEQIVGLRTVDGWISQVANRGVGADLADDGFSALVKPFRIGVVGNGS